MSNTHLNRELVVIDADVAATRNNAAILTAAKSVLSAALAVAAEQVGQADQADHDQAPAAASERDHAPGETSGAALEPVEPILPHARSRMLTWWRWRVGATLIGANLLATVLAWGLVRVDPWPLAPVAIAAVTLIVGSRLDLHRSRLELSVLEDAPAYLFVSLSSAATALAVEAAHGGPSTGFGAAFLFAATQFGLLIVLRAGLYSSWRYRRRAHKASHPVLIVGSGDVAERLASAMQTYPEYGLDPVGFVDPYFDNAGARRRKLPVFGGLGSLASVMAEHDVNDIIFAFGREPDARLVRVVQACLRKDCQVFVVPRFFELYGADRRSHVEIVWGVPLVRLRRFPLRPGHTMVKRGMDIAISAVSLVLLAPVFAACGLAVLTEGGRGIIFKQTRLGRNDRPFTMYKFRSMAPVNEKERDRTWTIDGDNRIGPVGKFLRRTGVDEMPQLFNVLRGDMSIVGPRPERPHFSNNFDHVVRGYRDRRRVASGLTGLAQVNGLRGDTSIHDRISFDNYYIDTWSLWTDVKIMLRTASTMFRGHIDGAPSAEPVPELMVSSTGSGSR